jgi:hypothetical protein
MKLTLVTGVTGLVVLLVIVELLRRRQLREKYAILWLVVGLVIIPLALFPWLLDDVAGALGVASGVSLVLFLGIVFLLLVCVHLSWEVSRLEEETRTIAEDLALLRTEVRADRERGWGDDVRPVSDADARAGDPT